MKELYNSFKNQPLYIMFDETKDRKQQNVLNILIGKVRSNNYEKPRILYSDIIDNTKAETIIPLLKNVLQPLCGYNLNKKIINCN